VAGSAEAFSAAGAVTEQTAPGQEQIENDCRHFHWLLIFRAVNFWLARRLTGPAKNSAVACTGAEPQ
jgi:hypothetical protein